MIPIHSWNKTFSRSALRTRRPATAPGFAGLERLERRDVPASSVILQPDGVLNIVGGDFGGGSFVDIKIDTVGTNTTADDSIVVKVGAKGSTPSTDYLWSTWYFPLYSHPGLPPGPANPNSVKTLMFTGGKGPDQCWNETNLVSFQKGMGGDDVLSGGSNYDSLDGGHGSDHVYGNGGPDVLYGDGPSQGGVEPGVLDYILGGPGDDDVSGGAGHVNVIHGDGGNDVLLGGGYGATNMMDGGPGDDWLIGGSGKQGAMEVNMMSDHTGGDTFVGGNYALNHMDAGDKWSNDVLVISTSSSVNNVAYDPGDVIWKFGPYPKKPHQ